MTCTCGHDAEAHQHFRRGTDCGLCACRRLRVTAPDSYDAIVDGLAAIPAGATLRAVGDGRVDVREPITVPRGVVLQFARR